MLILGLGMGNRTVFLGLYGCDRQGGVASFSIRLGLLDLSEALGDTVGVMQLDQAPAHRAKALE